MKMKFLLVPALLFTFNGYSMDAHKHDHSKMKMGNQMNMKKNIKMEKREELSESAKKEVDELLKLNEKLHLAFFNYSGPEVEKISSQLGAKALELKDASLKGLLSFSSKKLLDIKTNNTREANNKLYYHFSMALEHIIKKYDVGSGYNIYYCPHAKMKWIQNTKVISQVYNPYVSNMKHCGEQQTNY